MESQRTIPALPNVRDFVVRTRDFIFCRPTYHQRRIVLLRDGTVGTGAGSDARSWHVNDDALWIERDNCKPWKLSLRPNGVFRGECVDDSAARVVLASAVPPQLEIDTRNELEIRIFGQKRSGHHAIIGWLGSQLGHGNFFFNDCCAFVDPFRTHVNTLPFIQCYRAFANHRSEGRSQYEPFHDTAGVEAERAEQVRVRPKARLIVSFEDFNLECYERHVVQTADVGNSVRRVNLLVLRDPFNLLASLIRERGGDITRWKYAGICSTWEQYAREMLGETNFLEHKVCVSYNRWFVDRPYRDQIASEFGATNRDIGLLTVPPNGRGSSFDGLVFDGKAQEMQVFRRWQEFADNPQFWALFAYRELGRLASALFGDVIATLPRAALRASGVSWD